MCVKPQWPNNTRPTTMASEQEWPEYTRSSEWMQWHYEAAQQLKAASEYEALKFAIACVLQYDVAANRQTVIDTCGFCTDMYPEMVAAMVFVDEKLVEDMEPVTSILAMLTANGWEMPFDELVDMQNVLQALGRGAMVPDDLDASLRERVWEVIYSYQQPPAAGAGTD